MEKKGVQRHGRARFVAAAVVVLLALIHAFLMSWTCDDAYVSYRYAENLIEGRGLVFNPGERVEGMTNMAWTLWIGLGMILKVRPESWSGIWALAAYVIALGALWRWEKTVLSEVRETAFVPVALLVGAANPDWAIFATSGLETSAFTTTVFLGYLFIARGFSGRQSPRVIASALTMTLASALRPDGVAFAFGAAVVLGVMGARTWSQRRLDLIKYLTVFSVLWGGYTALRVAYYGDFFPNTYYAKSGGTPYWEQGMLYVGLYIQRYWMLAPFVLLAPAVALWRHRTLREPNVAEAVSAACFVLGYAGYVARVGGDFMFARFMVPTTPFVAVCCASLVRSLGKVRLQFLCGVLLAMGVALSTSPVERGSRRGIIDERDFWTRGPRVARLETYGAALRRGLDGLPVTLAHPAGHIRAIYKSHVHASVDFEGGLTEYDLARTKVTRRGRPGHEKRGDYAYVARRGAHFLVGDPRLQMMVLDRYIPLVPLVIHGAPVWMIRWDPEIMDRLAERGITVPPFDAQLDEWIAELDSKSDAEVKSLFEGLRRFYFDHVEDPRQRAFVERLGRESGAGSADTAHRDEPGGGPRPNPHQHHGALDFTSPQ